MSDVPQIAVVGNGYWGKNLIRTFHNLGALRWVCDTRAESIEEARRNYQVQTTQTLNCVLEDKETQAVAIAAPAARHFDLASQCLRAGKHVYVEKPLALHADEGEQLCRLASQGGRVLMVGHILEYHPAILELKRLIWEGALGNLQYIYSSRLNLGKLRTEENILWSFAPHDISAILFLLGEMPVRIAAQGGNYLNNNVDTTLTTAEFRSGVKAHFFVSWLHPFKEQKLAIVGGRKMAVFDDVEPERKLVLYSHRIEWRDRVPVAEKDAGQVVPLPNHEPLKLECEHFLNCVRTGTTPRTSGESALRVLRVLEACEESLRRKGAAVELEEQVPRYFAHPSACIDEGCEIGEGTKIWHFSHVMAGARLGSNCNLGQNVVVSPGCKIGHNVKVQNNVSIYTGVELEDDVFCGPSMVFTNVINPRSHITRKDEYRPTLVRKGASIGANATVVCGATIGEYAFIAAGAVVTRDVPSHALMAGVPARRVGWMCYCGVRLPDGTSAPACSACGRTYSIVDGSCRSITTVIPMKEKIAA